MTNHAISRRRVAMINHVYVRITMPTMRLIVDDYVSAYAQSK